MRIVFMGTPDFAVASLRSLLQAGHEVVAVVTATDKPGGRGRKTLIACPVAQFAREQGLPVLQPVRLRDPDFIAQLQSLEAELFVVVAFRMLPEVIWAMPPKGTVNLHGSLLPAYRGAAPIHWAVLHGERETGVTIFFLRHEIDTGDVLLREHLPIGPRETTGEVHDRMMAIGARALVRALNLIASGDYTTQAQPLEAPSHAPKLYPETARLQPNWTCEHVLRWIRGMSPYPGAWFILEDKKYKVFHAEAVDLFPHDAPGTLQRKQHQLLLSFSDGWLSLLEIQPEGRQRMGIRDFLNGIGWPDGHIGQIPSNPDNVDA